MQSSTSHKRIKCKDRPVIKEYIYLYDIINLFVFAVYRYRVRVFNATFSNISVISWLSVVLVEEFIHIIIFP
jgi:hypothetical protein